MPGYDLSYRPRLPTHAKFISLFLYLYYPLLLFIECACLLFTCFLSQGEGPRGNFRNKLYYRKWISCIIYCELARSIHKMPNSARAEFTANPCVLALPLSCYTWRKRVAPDQHLSLNVIVISFYHSTRRLHPMCVWRVLTLIKFWGHLLTAGQLFVGLQFKQKSI